MVLSRFSLSKITTKKLSLMMFPTPLAARCLLLIVWYSPPQPLYPKVMTPFPDRRPYYNTSLQPLITPTKMTTAICYLSKFRWKNPSELYRIFSFFDRIQLTIHQYGFTASEAGIVWYNAECISLQVLNTTCTASAQQAANVDLGNNPFFYPAQTYVCV